MQQSIKHVLIGQKVKVSATAPLIGLIKGAALKQDELGEVLLRVPSAAYGIGSDGRPNTVFSIKVTLVWSDQPGAIVQNDLELQVRSSDAKFRRRCGQKGNVKQIFLAGQNTDCITATITPVRINHPP